MSDSAGLLLFTSKSSIKSRLYNGMVRFEPRNVSSSRAPSRTPLECSRSTALRLSSFELTKVDAVRSDHKSQRQGPEEFGSRRPDKVEPQKWGS
ncbi:hypothetical protein Ddc_03591 [Ditylenchus destructor]|nr:hypothetical protein Ddc_03591 [Ditylenchus destructor]